MEFEIDELELKRLKETYQLIVDKLKELRAESKRMNERLSEYKDKNSLDFNLDRLYLSDKNKEARFLLDVLKTFLGIDSYNNFIERF